MYIKRSTGALSGVLIVLLGIWGGIVPFIGPYFNFAFGSTATWHYDANRLWLDILPAVAAIIGGGLMISTGHRLRGIVGSSLALAGGAWFVLGPSVSRIWEHGAGGPIGAPLYGSVRQMLELVTYFYAVGVLIIALAAFALGRFVSRPTPVVEPAAGGFEDASPRYVDETGEEPVTAHEPATAQTERQREPESAPAEPSSVSTEQRSVPAEQESVRTEPQPVESNAESDSESDENESSRHERDPAAAGPIEPEHADGPTATEPGPRAPSAPSR